MSSEFSQHRACVIELDTLIRSNHPLIVICTHEERRVMEAIEAICRREKESGALPMASSAEAASRHWLLYTWDIASGLQTKSANTPLPPETSMGQDEILHWFDGLERHPKNLMQILVVKDFEKFFGGKEGAGQMEHEVARQLRNMAQKFISQPKCVILMSTSFSLPPELMKLSKVIDWPLPEPEHIKSRVNYLLSATRAGRPEVGERFNLNYKEEEMDAIASAFQGLTIDEVELLCYYSMMSSRAFEPGQIAQKKRDIIRKSGVLDWIETTEEMEDVGGLEELKRWLHTRRNAFSGDAKAFGLPASPKGVLLVGVQGCGKSHVSKAIASYWKLPLLQLDMGKVFNQYVGNSEENIRAVIRVAESVSPCVLAVDEIDKGLASSGGEGDGGTARRVMGALLTWMQEKVSPVFLVGTANSAANMPPELLRKGRFDEIFFVDLPSEEERRAIFSIHIEKIKRHAEDFDLILLASKSEGHTGAEIAAAIESALYTAFDADKRGLTTEDILEAMAETTPLSIMMSEKIAALREWASARARHASYPKTPRLNPLGKESFPNAENNTISENTKQMDDSEEL